MSLFTWRKLLYVPYNDLNVNPLPQTWTFLKGKISLSKHSPSTIITWKWRKTHKLSIEYIGEHIKSEFVYFFFNSSSFVPDFTCSFLLQSMKYWIWDYCIIMITFAKYKMEKKRFSSFFKIFIISPVIFCFILSAICLKLL